MLRRERGPVRSGVNIVAKRRSGGEKKKAKRAPSPRASRNRKQGKPAVAKKISRVAEVEKTKRPIVHYDHKGKTRANNPPVGLVTPQTDPDPEKKKTYQYDPHLDPQLVWAGKAERCSFQVPTVSLHVHERIDPRTIIRAVQKRNGGGSCSSEQARPAVVIRGARGEPTTSGSD